MRAAVYCGTRNIYKDMLPSMKSLLRYSNVEKVYFLIEDDEFPYELPPEVECINVSNQPWFTEDGPNFACHWSYMILVRAAFAKIFPNLDQILSLDCDTIVANNISELWELPLDDYYFASVIEPEKTTDTKLYVNAGVMVFNLKKIREDHKDDEYIKDLNNCFRYYPEQECFSALSQGKILILPSKYNLSGVTAPTNEEKILHYAGTKNWKQKKLVQEYQNMPMNFTRDQIYNTEISTTIDNNSGYILFTNPQDNITEENLQVISKIIKENSAGYMFTWGNNCLVLKREFINRYNIDISRSVYGLIRISYIILSYIQSFEHSKRIFMFNDILVEDKTDFHLIFKNTIEDNYLFIKKCQENQIPMAYAVHEISYMIVWLYWLFLSTIQEHPEYAQEHWTLIREFYYKFYYKYELTASMIIQEAYYKINTKLIIPKTRTWPHMIRVNFNRFLQELKESEELPRRYKFD